MVRDRVRLVERRAHGADASAEGLTGNTGIEHHVKCAEEGVETRAVRVQMAL